MTICKNIATFSFLFVSQFYCISNIMAEETISECVLNLTLNEFRAHALQHSPLVGEIDASYSIELAKAFGEEVLTNPELQVEQTFTGMKLSGDNDPQSTVSLGQAIKLSNFGSRERLSSLIREVGDLQKQIDLLELSQNLLLQYHTLEMLDETEQILISARERSIKKIHLIKEGVKKGLFSEGEERLFEAEAALLEAQKRGLDAHISEYKAEIGKTLGSNCRIKTPGHRITLEALPSLGVLINKALSSKMSESSRLKSLSKQATEKEKVSKLDAFPSIIPKFIYQHTNDSGDFYGAGISIPLPFWNRNQGEILTASAKVNSLQKKQAFLDTGGLEEQLRHFLSSAKSTRDQSEIFATKVVPNFSLALEAQEKIYSQGKGSILQVWQMQRTLYEAQMQELTLWLDALKTRIKLSILVGEEI